MSTTPSVEQYQRWIAMYLVQILLPRADKNGLPFAREVFDEVKEELVSRFEGVTAYLQAPAEGLWRRDNKSDADEIVIFEVMTEDIHLPDWRRRRSALERRFRQDAIVIRYTAITLI